MIIHAYRFRPGADLKNELKRLVRENAIKAGAILTCVGSLSTARVRLAGAQPDDKVFRQFDEETEIVSLVGTLSQDGIHVHLTIAARDGSCYGGHLEVGCIVKTTAEVVICELPDHTFHRTKDDATGFRELHIEQR